MYRPWTGRTIGIEMEMNTTTTRHDSLSEGTIRRALQGATQRLNTRGAGYYHSDGSAWDIKLDGSCGYEIASPALYLNEEGENAELEAVCNALGTLSPMINRQCGLHVHVDCRDFDWNDMRRLLALWARYEPFFYGLCPPSRRTNTYCGAVRKTTWSGSNSRNWDYAAKPAINADNRQEFERYARYLPRYTSLNVSGWWTHGRVEFRLHSGTINYPKIRNWAKLLLALVTRAKNAADDNGTRKFPHVSKVTERTSTVPFDTYYICKALGLIRSKYVTEVPASNEALVAWAEARRRQFNPNEPRTIRGRRAAMRDTSAAQHIEERNTMAREAASDA